MMATQALGPILYTFFEDHLRTSKGLRPASIRSYRDTLRLFLQYTAQDAHRRISRLTLQDLRAERVLGFLNSLERERRNHIRTRNQRLAALRGFFDYVGGREPEMLAEAARVVAIPTKRVPPAETIYLERDEVEAVLAGLPSEGRQALRDRALLLFLYNTGARVQEVADLRGENLELGTHPLVRLHGKGDKWRVCPLWTQTADLLQRLLEEKPVEEQAKRPVFSSDRGHALTRFGIYKIVRRHTRHLAKKRADAGPVAISPHVFRHTTAVHLLEAGVEVNVIRAWLGHQSLETTNRYAEVNLRTKMLALQTCEPPVTSSAGFPRGPVWRDDPSLLNWLQSL
ncbi:MAG: tyrosine-type recombinase/integrase [Armatimonadota bacterium]|jgi:site-specific recombinase XerD